MIHIYLILLADIFYLFIKIDGTHINTSYINLRVFGSRGALFMRTYGCEGAPPICISLCTRVRGRGKRKRRGSHVGYVILLRCPLNICIRKLITHSQPQPLLCITTNLLYSCMERFLIFQRISLTECLLNTLTTRLI